MRLEPYFPDKDPANIAHCDECNLSGETDQHEKLYELHLAQPDGTTGPAYILCGIHVAEMANIAEHALRDDGGSKVVAHSRSEFPLLFDGEVVGAAQGSN